MFGEFLPPVVAVLIADISRYSRSMQTAKAEVASVGRAVNETAAVNDAALRQMGAAGDAYAMRMTAMNRQVASTQLTLARARAAEVNANLRATAVARDLTAAQERLAEAQRVVASTDEEAAAAATRIAAAQREVQLATDANIRAQGRLAIATQTAQLREMDVTIASQREQRAQIAETTRAELAAASERSAAVASFVHRTRTFLFGLTAAFAGAAAVGARMSANLQSQLMILHTQAGVSVSQLPALKQIVMELAAQIGYSPQSLAQALYHVESAWAGLGITARQAGYVTGQAARLAAIGHSDLTQTTYALVSVMQSYRMRAMDAAKATSELNAIVGSGDMTMQGLVNALGTGFLDAAQTMGISLQSAGAALATLTDRGMQADVAATRLKMAMVLLAAPGAKASSMLKGIGLPLEDIRVKTKAMADALTAAGLTTFKMAADLHKPNGLLVALRDLTKHLSTSGLAPDAQHAVIARAFGGGRSGVGVMTLLNNLTVDSKKYAEQQRLVARYGKDWAATAATVTQQEKMLKGAVDDALISIGDAMLPTILKIIRALKELAMWITKHKALTRDFSLALLILAASFAAVTAAAFLLENALAIGVAVAIAAVVFHMVQAHNGANAFRGILHELLPILSSLGRQALSLGRDLWQVAQPLARLAGRAVILALHAVVAVMSLLAHHATMTKSAVSALVTVYLAYKATLIATIVQQKLQAAWTLTTAIRTRGLAAALGLATTATEAATAADAANAGALGAESAAALTARGSLLGLTRVFGPLTLLVAGLSYTSNKAAQEGDRYQRQLTAQAHLSADAFRTMAEKYLNYSQATATAGMRFTGAVQYQATLMKRALDSVGFDAQRLADIMRTQGAAAAHNYIDSFVAAWGNGININMSGMGGINGGPDKLNKLAMQIRASSSAGPSPAPLPTGGSVSSGGLGPGQGFPVGGGGSTTSAHKAAAAASKAAAAALRARENEVRRLFGRIDRGLSDIRLHLSAMRHNLAHGHFPSEKSITKLREHIKAEIRLAHEAVRKTLHTTTAQHIAALRRLQTLQQQQVRLTQFLKDVADKRHKLAVETAKKAAQTHAAAMAEKDSCAIGQFHTLAALESVRAATNASTRVSHEVMRRHADGQIPGKGAPVIVYLDGKVIYDSMQRRALRHERRNNHNGLSAKR